MHKVIRKFQDKDGRVYNIGDDYPNVDAKKPTNARIKVLSTNGNKYKQIYIEAVETAVESE